MELYVFDENLERLGVIDGYTEAEFDLKYQNHKSLFFVCSASENNKSLLISEDKRILVKSTDLKRGYELESCKYEDEIELKMLINAKSLSIILNTRLILGQQRFIGNIEDVFKAFVNANCINPADPNRIIQNLILGENQGIDINIDESFTNILLDIALWEMSVKYDIAFEVLINHDLKKYVFTTFQGANRSAEQDENPQIIFAKTFDNVNLQSYMDDKSNYKNMVYVAGEGEGINRIIVPVNNSLSGFKRRELFVDARDLQKQFEQDGITINLTQEQYETLLINRGDNTLSDYKRIQSFSSEIDPNAQFIFDVDYFLGDKVSNRNDDLSIIMHSRIATAKEHYSRSGYTLSLEFGTSIPDKFEQIVKKQVKKVK